MIPTLSPMNECREPYRRARIQLGTIPNASPTTPNGTEIIIQSPAASMTSVRSANSQSRVASPTPRAMNCGTAANARTDVLLSAGRKPSSVGSSGPGTIRNRHPWLLKSRSRSDSMHLISFFALGSARPVAATLRTASGRSLYGRADSRRTSPGTSGGAGGRAG